MEESNLDKYLDYPKKVVNGEIVACTYVKLACQRYLDWMDREDIEFRTEKVDRVINFISKLKHFTGRFNNKPFILEPFQKWMVCNIFGFYYKGTEERVIKNVWIELARKNGKSQFSAALALYCLIADGEANAEVEFIANSRKQAQICFDMCRNMIDKLDPRHKIFKSYRDKIKFDKTKSFLQVLSSDSGANDGWNSKMFVADEVHAYPDSKMFDVMKSSQGMRDCPIALAITTAGFNLFSFAYGMRKTNIEVLYGKKQDDSQFTAIYTLDEDDDFRDESVWIKANPNLGVTVKPQYLREQVQQAKNNTALEISTRTKNFNQWLASSDIWISNDILLEHSQKVNIEDYKDQELFPYMGVDLSSVSDLTCVSLLLPLEDEKFVFKNYYYLPKSALDNNSNADLYRLWYNKGYLTVTQGNVCDYDYIISDIMKINNILPLQMIGYDKWNATQAAIQMTELGLPLQPYPQSIANFSMPTKALERIIKMGNAIIDDNEITRFCFSNVVLKHDWNDNIKPIKEENQQKIDGVIAMIQALGTFLSQTHYNNEILGFQVNET